MNKTKTPKIVVGAGLAAVYAAGLAIFVLPGAQGNAGSNAVSQNTVPQNAEAPMAPLAADLAAPADVALSGDASISVTEQTAAPTLAAVPAATAPQPLAALRPAERSEAKVQDSEEKIASVVTALPAPRIDVEESSVDSKGVRTGNERLAGDLPLPAQPTASSDEQEPNAEVSPGNAADSAGTDDANEAAEIAPPVADQE